MNEIICPHCKKAFKIDEAGYADILKQVRDHEFDQALHERLEAAEKDKASAVELAQEKTKSELRTEFVKIQKELSETQAAKNAEIAKLQSKLDATETEKKLALTEAVNKLEKERDELANKLESKDTQAKLLESSLKDKYETELKSKDEMIAYYKDMKAKLSTKMVGETLEQHCEYEFNRLRATAFPNAYFEKDNDASSGSKGDYIYRETDENGTEIISIMFEMKNEGDETATKKRNEDFLKRARQRPQRKEMRIRRAGKLARRRERAIQRRHRRRWLQVSENVRNSSAVFHPDHYGTSQRRVKLAEVQKRAGSGARSKRRYYEF